LYNVFGWPCYSLHIFLIENTYNFDKYFLDGLDKILVMWDRQNFYVF